MGHPLSFEYFYCSERNYFIYFNWYTYKDIRGYEFWRYVGVDVNTNLSLNIHGKSIKLIPLLLKGMLMRCLL